MAIIATFPEGVTCVTVNGLHQWDYGRTLEIHDPTLPALVEVHFGYMGAREAAVRSCDATSGVATVAIPDACLEQAAAVTAWVYALGETTGRTIRTVVLPIVARPRPAALADLPSEDVSNKYTEAVNAMNAAVEDVKNGNVSVTFASNAQTAAVAEVLQHQGWTNANSAATWVTKPGVYILRFGVSVTSSVYTAVAFFSGQNTQLDHKFFVGVVGKLENGTRTPYTVTGCLDEYGHLHLTYEDPQTASAWTESVVNYQYIPLTKEA